LSSATTGPVGPPIGRIIIRSVNWLGDAVMTTPALLRLREALPGVEIHLLSPQKLAALWLAHPAVDHVVAFGPGEGAWQVSRRIRPEKAQVSLILPNSFRSALEPWLARVPRRIGIATPGRRWWLTEAVKPDPKAVPMRKRSPEEIRAGLQETRPIPSIPSPESHHIRHYLRLVGALGADPTPIKPVLRVTEDERTAMRSTLMAALPPGARDQADSGWIGINPGAEYGPAKRWPAENFGRLLQDLRARGCRLPVVVFGGRADVETARVVASHGSGNVVNLAGRTGLRELMAAMTSLRVLVTNDTGPMHVAAALGVPVVVPFGSTSPELTGPGLPGDPRHRLLRAGVPCSPCFLRQCPIDLRCLTRISPDQVTDAVMSVLASTAL
jgi:heptosyltransferase II